MDAPPRYEDIFNNEVDHRNADHMRLSSMSGVPVPDRVMEPDNTGSETDVTTEAAASHSHNPAFPGEGRIIGRSLPVFMKGHQKDNSNIFVSTEAFTASDDMLMGYKVLMLTGAPGTGKTMIAEQLMLKLWDVKACYPFRPTNPSEYVRDRNTKILQVFHIDDAFGASIFDKGKYDAWMSIVESMREDLRSKNIYIIFTSRDNILNQISTAVKNHEIFSHIVNLSDEKFKLTTQNKHDIFENHARDNELDIAYKDIVEPKMRKEDSAQAAREPMGYPQRVRLLCSMKNVTTESRLRYFRHPMEFLSNIIASYRETDSLSYCVLVLVMMNDGKISNSFFHDYDKSSMQKIQKCMDICRLPASTTIMDDLRATAYNLCGSFLLHVNDCFIFQHESVMEAVTFNLGNKYISDILNFCSIKFLLERVFTKCSTPPDNECVVILHENMFPQLCKRLVMEIERCAPKILLKRVYYMIRGHDESMGAGDSAILKSLSTYRVFRDADFLNVFLPLLQQTDSFHLLFTSSSPDSRHPTFMFLAASSGQDVFIHEVISFYLRDVKRLSGFKDHLNRIMYAACYSGYPAVVRELLAVGARADCMTAHTPDDLLDGTWDYRHKCTTLMLAAYSGSVEVLRLVCDRLLQQKVDVTKHINIRDSRDESRGRTALHWWACGERGAASLQFLLEAGADINARNKVGRTALYTCAFSGDKAAVGTLLKAGAEVNVRTTDIDTTIEYEHGQALMVMNPDMRDECGRTALHCSAAHGYEAIVQLLVAAGADIHIRASTPPWFRKAGHAYYTDKTPLQVAVLFKRTAIADFFRSLQSN